MQRFQHKEVIKFFDLVEAGATRVFELTVNRERATTHLGAR